MAFTTRSFLFRLAVGVGIVLLFAVLSRAGGPEYVAGTSYFLPGTSGLPLLWSGGLVTDYTDQGALSPILPGPSADAMVADAWSQWSSVSTAAIAATRRGQLAEDVNGSNVLRNGDGTITMPPTSAVMLRVNQTTGVSDTNGMASIVPSVGTFNGPREVDVLVTTGAAATLNYVLDAFPAMHGANFPLRTLVPLPAPVRTRAPADER